MDGPLLFLSAGDPSGDNATSRVIAALKAQHSGLRFFGLGGEKLHSLGQEQFAEGSDLAVLGFWEVARQVGFFRRLLNRCVDEIKSRRPKAILLVDYPGFNLRLAKRLKPLGIPIVYYISPQVWAWGKKRLAEIRALVDRMLVILPFEEAFYRQHGIACDFVGHYLLEDIPAEYISSRPPGNGQLALLPGSRTQEVQRILPVMAQSAATLKDRHGLRAVVAAVRGVSTYDAILRRYPGVEIVYDRAREIVNESDYVLTASGTATLETGIIARPMVVAYRTGFITYQIARRLVDLDSIALVNLVAGERIVPELIQHEASAANLVAAVERYLGDAAYREQTTARLHRVPDLLGGTGASERAARLIGGYL